MGTARPLRRPAPDAEGLHLRAAENLHYIRSTMERAGSFTAVPGLGGVGMGVTALVAAWLAHHQTSAKGWLWVWLTELALAFCIGLLTMIRKARISRVSLWSEPARKFATSFLPALVAGAALTPAIAQAGLLQVVAACWLLLYGVAIIAGGAFSVRIVPAMGAAFLGLGLLMLLTPAAWCDAILAAGFGGLHLIFGIWIYRRFGG
jgi:MFS family permease